MSEEKKTDASTISGTESSAGTSTSGRCEKPIYLSDLTSNEIADEKSLIKEMKKDILYVCIFTATWCGGCVKLKEYLNKSYAEYKGTTKIVYIDCDKYQELCQSLEVSSIPDTRVYKSGKHIANFIGSNVVGFSKVIKSHESPRASENILACKSSH